MAESQYFLDSSPDFEKKIKIGSFVLIYEVTESAVRLLDFDHHDRIYKFFSY